MRTWVFICAVLAPAIAAPCINDRDTLGFELHNRPDVQRALTGRFDRYPPLYYVMRIARLRGLKTLTPAEYDDLAVAYGRLGRNDEALKVLSDKAKLPHLSSDERYRLYANRGTFEAHKWFKDGAKVSELAELRQAAADVAEAMRINPHAHFGREGTQLEVLRWVIDMKTPGKHPRKTLTDWLQFRLDGVDIPTTMSGLIMLGGAWESPDAALAIAGIAASHHKEQTALLALQRYDELVRAGAKPLVPQLADETVDIVRELTKYGGTLHADETPTPQRFQDLRKEAESWHAAKTAFMEERLRAGRHPDTDPDFWQGWTEKPMPELPTHRGTSLDVQILLRRVAAIAFPAILLAIAAGLAWRRRHAAQATGLS